jgi:hypothetical protein
MSNKVGDNRFTPAQLDALKKKISEVVSELKAHGALLSSEERTRLTRPRIGGEPYVEEMIGIVDKHGLESKKRYPLQGMRDDLAVASDYKSLLKSLEEALQICNDTINTAGSEYWEGFLFYRGTTQSMAARDPEIENDTKNIDAFMSTGPRKPEPPKE